MKYPIKRTMRKIGSSNWISIPSYFFENNILQEGQEIELILIIKDKEEVENNGESDNGKNNTRRS